LDLGTSQRTGPPRDEDQQLDSDQFRLLLDPTGRRYAGWRGIYCCATLRVSMPWVSVGCMILE
jgi:hypothetical protein